MIVPPRVAAAVGYVAGLMFFGCDFAWFGETAGALLGPVGPLLDIGPALIEATAFGLAAALTSLASTYVHGGWRIVAVAGAFALAELWRSSGILGAPLYQIGAAFVDTPLAVLAAFGGVHTLTFAVALVSASFADWIRARNRRTAFGIAYAVAGVTFVAGASWIAWPARTVPAGTLRVAAVQGNIRQSVKWDPRSLPIAVARYTSLTARLRSFRPAFVLWPETVITTDLQLDPALAAIGANGDLVATDRQLHRQFAALAHALGAVIGVGSTEATVGGPYNALFFFTPGGAVEATYRKRQLVPFAEFLPGPASLRTLPFAALVSNFVGGSDPGPFDARLRVAPLICWEAGFSDLAYEAATRGARFYAVATDDAWFGDSDGPYAQAQLAQLRAIETGRWVVRAAATGISGIVAPDGRWRERTRLDTQAVVTGTIGEPMPTLFSRIGPWTIGALLAALVVGAFALGRRPAP